jgi:hypothetical protein
MSDWEISRSAGECFGTGEQIEHGQEYFAALVEGEDGLVRRDFSFDTGSVRSLRYFVTGRRNFLSLVRRRSFLSMRRCWCRFLNGLPRRRNPRR